MSTKNCPQTLGAQGFENYQFLDVYHVSTNATFSGQTPLI